MYIPERNLTKEELILTLSARKFRKKQCSKIAGQHCIDSIEGAEKNLNNFTNEMFAEEFGIITIKSDEDYCLKFKLRTNAYHAAYFANKISFKVLQGIINFLVFLSEKVSFRLLDNKDYFTKMIIHLETGEIITINE